MPRSTDHITEVCVALAFGYFQRVKDSGHWGLLDISHVCVPDCLAVAEIPNWCPSAALTFEMTLISGYSGKNVTPYGFGPGGSSSQNIY